METEAYKLGYVSSPIDLNPYPIRTTEFNEWVMGRLQSFQDKGKVIKCSSTTKSVK